MNRREAEQQIYRTTTVGQLLAALAESRDQTDIRHVFEHHEGGTLGFQIAYQRLGVSKSDWDYANNVAGFYALVGMRCYRRSGRLNRARCCGETED